MWANRLPGTLSSGALPPDDIAVQSHFMAVDGKYGLPRPRTRASRRSPRHAAPRPASPVIDLTISSDEVHSEPKSNESYELMSSPIKRPRTDKGSSPHTQSPKKRVVFLDFLVSDAPSSPNHAVTPKKSILKNVPNLDYSPSDPNNTALWDEANQHSPMHAKFWLPGTIIRLPAASSELPQLINGCLVVLQDDTFDKRFEVYATINNMCKTTSVETVLKLLVIQKDGNEENHIATLSQYIQRDIRSIEGKLFVDEDKENIKEEEPTKGDPFSIRIISQALKFIFFVVSSPELNVFLSVADIKWFYSHACDMIARPDVSKTLLLPYLSIIKDFKFSSNRKKLIFDLADNIPETILSTVLNMRNLPSSSLIVEKFVTLRNLVINFPIMMANHFHLWFPTLLVNLCDLSSPLYLKIINMGVVTLLEVARNFLDNKNVVYSVRRFLEAEISPIKLFSDNTVQSGQRAIDFVVSSLQALSDTGQHKTCMDIWVGVTLLVGNHNFETWPHLKQWLQIHKSCTNHQDTDVKITALTSWKAVVYNILSDLADLKRHLEPFTTSPKKANTQLGNALRAKVKVLISPFMNVSSTSDKTIDTLHSIFLSILYTLLNPLTMKTSMRYTHVYWDKIIQPIFSGFYFKKGASATLHNLGFKVLSRLLRKENPVGERSFNEIRCLSNDMVTLNEINSLNPKWVHARFERVLHYVMVVVKLNVSSESKLSVLNQYLANIKVVTKKELTPSDTTFDIIDNLALVVEEVLNVKPPQSVIYSLVLNLNDTFGGANLLATPAQSVYLIVLSKATLTPAETDDMLSLMLNSADKRALAFILELLKINKAPHSAFIVQQLNSRRFNINSNSDLATASEMFQVLDHDFGHIAKKLIQDIVLLKPDEFERIVQVLRINCWHLAVFKFVITLIHDAPYAHLKQMAFNLILLRWELHHEFLEILQFLAESKFDLEIFNLRKNLSKKIRLLDEPSLKRFSEVWDSYLKTVQKGGNFVLFDELLVATFEDFDVRPFVCDNWDKLPLLKEQWLMKHGKLYVGEPKNVDDTEVSAFKEAERAVDSLHGTPETMNPETIPEPEATDNTIDEVSEEPALSTSQEGFDIHTFTALLNSKLEEKPLKRPRRSRRQSPEAKEDLIVEDLFVEPKRPNQEPSPKRQKTEPVKEVPVSDDDTLKKQHADDDEVITSDPKKNKELPDSSLSLHPSSIQAHSTAIADTPLHQVLAISDEQIRNLTPNQRHDLETETIRFLYRLRTLA